MQKSSNTRVALLGCGYWGRNLARVFRELGVLERVCDTSSTALEEVGKRHGISASLDISAALDDPNIDAVAVATPAATHFEVVRRALLAGKHVFVEKPMSLRVRDGKELVDTANKVGRILMVGHILQYHAAVVKLQELIQKGELGKLQFVSSHRLNFGKIRQEENALWSFAPHDLSVMLSLIGQSPEKVTCHGGSFLNHSVADITTTHLDFPNGVKGHLFMSWLHPFKEQKLVVVGNRKMAVFDDVEKENKLMIYDHEVGWENHEPVARKTDGVAVALDLKEPLMEECLHFLDSIERGCSPKTDGEEGLRVLETLKACQRSLESGSAVKLGNLSSSEFFVHESSYVDDEVTIGEGTRIWHFSHVMSGSKIGSNCSIGQNVTIGPKASIGNDVKIQNNVSVYEGVTLEDNVFCGPSAVFTNVTNPRSEVSRKKEFKKTLVRKGATLGANCTIICGNTVGRYAFIAAGAVAASDVPDFGLMAGVPARRIGWMSANGQRLNVSKLGDVATCSETGKKYRLAEEERLEEVD